MLEFEKKILLSESEYRFLKDCRYAEGKTAVQVNHYYDTDDFKLSRQGITCRIREKDGICIATTKAHQGKASDCSVENSRRVKDRYDDIVFRNRALYYQGSLETVRYTCWPPRAGISVMLDKNSYLNVVDYELEIEYEWAAEELAAEEIDGIAAELMAAQLLANEESFRERVGNGMSKSARFFCRKAEMAERMERWAPCDRF